MGGGDFEEKVHFETRMENPIKWESNQGLMLEDKTLYSMRSCSLTL